ACPCLPATGERRKLGLAPEPRHRVAARIHQHRGGPAVDRVLLPDHQVRVGGHRVLDAVPGHGLGDGADLLLRVELPGVDPHHLKRLAAEALLERPEHRESVQAVHATRGPEVEEDHPALQRSAEEERPVRAQPGAHPIEIGRPGVSSVEERTNGHRWLRQAGVRGGRGREKGEERHRRKHGTAFRVRTYPRATRRATGRFRFRDQQSLAGVVDPAAMWLQGNLLIVPGVLTPQSLAYGIAELAQQEGAEIVLTSFGRGMSLTERSAKRLDRAPEGLELDVTNSEHFSRLTEKLKASGKPIHGVLHAVAYAPEGALGGNFLNTQWESFATAFRVSTFSLKELAVAVAPVMTEGGSIVALDFDNSRQAWPIYDWMGVCKAAMISVIRYLARDLGPKNIRVNA